ncbi:unnamed protein product [Prunus brigantina]
MRNVQDILLKSTPQLKNCNLPYKENSFVIASSYAQLNELEKKNVDLTGKLLGEQICHEMRMSEMNENMSVLKSSLAKKDNELNSSFTTLHARKEAYFLLECKNADISQTEEQVADETAVEVEADLEKRAAEAAEQMAAFDEHVAELGRS